MKTRVALLRGINVGGHNKVPMARLREVCADLGWQDVRTYIQSGNVVFAATGSRAALEGALESAVRESFGLDIPVVVRDAAGWARVLAGNPFPAESETEPNLVLVGLARKKIASGAVDLVRERATGGERVERVGEAIWFHAANGSAKSKITPAVLDRAAGSPVTTRNWRTLLKIDAMMR